MPARVPLPAVDGGPEALFRLESVQTSGDVVSGSMPVGGWLAGPDGRTAAGALAVLVDDVLGYAIIAARPRDHWSVSTEITLDVFAALRTATGLLHAEARVVHTDRTGGFATGRVVDEWGEPVAVCAQRGRWIPVDADTIRPSGPDITLDPADAVGINALLGLGTRPEDDTLEVEVGPRVQNPLGNLHGGVSLAATDAAAARVLAATDGPPLVTASVHIAYVRPVPAGATVGFRPTVRQRGRTTGLVEVDGLVGDRLCTTARVVAQPPS